MPDKSAPSYTPYTLLRALTTLVERYAERVRPWRLESFLLWALGEPEARASSLGPQAQPLAQHALTPADQPHAPSTVFGPVPGYGEMSPAGEAARLVGTLLRRMRQAAKTTMAHDPIANLEDFGLMVHVLEQPGIHKTELITRNHMELSSGSDSIARLIRSGLLTEAVDPNDRRARKLNLSPQGLEALQRSFAQMNAVATETFGSLDPLELRQLCQLLGKVERAQRSTDAHA